MARPQLKGPGYIAVFVYGVFNDEESVADPEPVKVFQSQDSGAIIASGVRPRNVPDSGIIVVITI